jgi:hypothetical protein
MGAAAGDTARSRLPGKKPNQKAVDELVASYLLDTVREHAGDDEELLDKVLALSDLAAEREHSDGLARRIGDVRENPLVRGAIAAMGDRVQRLVDTGVKVAADTQVLRAKLRDRLAEKGLDPADDSDWEESVLEYERVLSETIPLSEALHNLEAVADLVDLANDVLHPGSGLKRHLYDMAWAAFRKRVFSDPDVLERVESLKEEVEKDPDRLKRVAKLIRKEGAAAVRDAYDRAEGEAKAPAPRRARPRKKAAKAAPRKKP